MSQTDATKTKKKKPYCVTQVRKKVPTAVLNAVMLIITVKHQLKLLTLIDNHLMLI